MMESSAGSGTPTMRSVNADVTSTGFVSVPQGASTLHVEQRPVMLGYIHTLTVQKAHDRDGSQVTPLSDNISLGSIKMHTRPHAIHLLPSVFLPAHTCIAYNNCHI